jgi:serine/threonine-protein kinase
MEVPGYREFRELGRAAGLTPAARSVITGGLVLATVAAVISAFVLWSDPPANDPSAQGGPARAASPALTGLDAVQPSSTPGAGSPAPSAADGARTREAPADSGTPAGSRSADGAPTGGPHPTGTHPAETHPTRGRDTTRTAGPSRRPTGTRRPDSTSRPTGRRSDGPTGRATAEPSSRPAAAPSRTPRPAPTGPPATQDTLADEPLLSVSASLGLPRLGGGDGLLGDGGGGLGAGLLGFVLVPGSALLGRHLAARRAAHSRRAAHARTETECAQMRGRLRESSTI